MVLVVIIYGLRRDSGPWKRRQFDAGLRPRERHVWILSYAVTASLLLATGLFLVLRKRPSHGRVPGTRSRFMIGNICHCHSARVRRGADPRQRGIERAIAREPLLVRAQRRSTLNPKARSR